MQLIRRRGRALPFTAGEPSKPTGTKGHKAERGRTRRIADGSRATGASPRTRSEPGVSSFGSALPSALPQAPGRSPPCAVYVAGADAKLFNNATIVVLMREGTRTVRSMQNNYQGPPEDFALVVPVSIVLQKATSDARHTNRG